MTSGSSDDCGYEQLTGGIWYFVVQMPRNKNAPGYVITGDGTTLSANNGNSAQTSC